MAPAASPATLLSYLARPHIEWIGVRAADRTRDRQVIPEQVTPID
jgi:hypothetical protein